MFWALMTDLKTVYRKIVAFEQASISLQYVEEWKYYELTNLKAKRPKNTRYMNSLVEFMATSTTEATETTTGPEDLKKIVCNFQKSWRWKIFILKLSNSLTNYIRIKVR